MIELYTFAICTIISLITYGFVSITRRKRADLKEALMLLVSSATLAGAIKVAVFAISGIGSGQELPLIYKDLPLAVAILAGALSLGWFAVEQVVIILFPPKPP